MQRGTGTNNRLCPLPLNSDALICNPYVQAFLGNYFQPSANLTKQEINKGLLWRYASRACWHKISFYNRKFSSLCVSCQKHSFVITARMLVHFYKSVHQTNYLTWYAKQKSLPVSRIRLTPRCKRWKISALLAPTLSFTRTIMLAYAFKMACESRSLWMQVSQRVTIFWSILRNFLQAGHLGREDTVVLVAHNGSLSQLMGHLLGT